MSEATTPKKERLFTFRSGGWVLLLAAVVTVVVSVQVVRLLKQHRVRTFGDGKNVATYRFSLVPNLIPTGEIVAAGFPRNGVSAMTDPAVMTAEELMTHPDRKTRKLLVSGDRVVGLSIGGEARAYPLRVLNWHEVANDTLGGVPVAVTWHPLTDGVVVFDRTVRGEVREFRVSGLLWNSGQLLFFRREEPGGESLFSQLLAKAVTGPLAEDGLELEVLPSEVLGWGEWRERHPETTVLAPDPLFRKHYPRRPYASYVGTRKLRYPVEPYPPAGSEAEVWMQTTVPQDEGAVHAFRWALHAVGR